MYKRQSLVKAVSLAVLSALATSAAVANDTQDTRQTIETILVVGEKTQRSLKDTTSSVSVISQDVLKTLQHLTITDAVSDISNVVVLSGAVPDIRGVSGNGAATGFNSFSGGAKTRVSTLIDGVVEPFVADLTGDSGIWDVEQIEVFRGPQSTSNGRNSIAGAIYIKTKDPTFDWQGAARAGYRDQKEYIDTSVMLSGPIVKDQLAFRVTAQQLDGETLSDGKAFATNPARFDLNALETTRLKSKLLWIPADNLSALLSLSSNDEQGNTGRIYFTLTNPWDYQPIFYRNMDTESDTTSLKINYQLNDDMALEVLTAYMDYQWGLDNYEADAADEQYVQMDENNTTLDAKFSFGLSNETLNGFVGLAHFERDQDFDSTGTTVYEGDDDSSSSAVYGEVTYALSNNLNLITGLRLEREKQQRHFDFRNGAIVADLDTNKTIKLPKLVIQYALTDNTTVSLGARRGYNAAGGALNFTAGEYYYYDEETVNTYEFTVRSALAGNNVNLSANLFFNDYAGYQALNSSRVIINLNDVQTYGAELEAVAMLTSALELKVSLGLLETQIKEAGSAYPDANDNELNSAPAITASVGARYWFNHALNASLSANYVDEYFGDFNNTEERIAGDYTLARVNVNYVSDNWQVSAFVNNLLDEQALVTQEPAGRSYPDGYAAIVDPRNVGASVTYHF